MSAPGGYSGDSHSNLKLVGGQFRFDSGATPRVVFRETEVVIGCKTISREAFDELNRRYQNFLRGTREQVIQG